MEQLQDEPKERWVALPFEICPDCGAEPRCYTKACAGWFYDGDIVECDCGMKGQVCCDSETPVYVMWRDEPAAVAKEEK